MSMFHRDIIVDLPKFQYITVYEAASHLNLSERTVRRWVAAGRIPSVRIGRAYLIPVGDFKRFIRSRASHPETLYIELDTPVVPKETSPPTTQAEESEVEKVEKYDGPMPPDGRGDGLEDARANKI